MEDSRGHHVQKREIACHESAIRVNMLHYIFTDMK
jgi:hypothetical protein